MSPLHVLAGYAAAIGLGTVLSTTFLVAPLVFKTLDEEGTTAFTTRLWPRYFTVNIVLGGLALVSILASTPAMVWATGCASGVIICMAVNRGLASRMRRQRTRSPADESPNSTYGLYHRATEFLNLTAGAGYALLLFRLFLA